MINKLIAFSLRNRVLVVAVYLGLALWGGWALTATPIDAIPDLSDNQVIVFTDWSGHSPQEVEDQVTYPLTTNLQGLAGVRVVRSQSAFGFSMIYVVFEDNVELYFGTDGMVAPIAYDFDFAGVVNATYAVPDEKLGIVNVRQRVFRGYCTDAGEYAKVFALFKEKKPEIYALYADSIGKLMDRGNVRSTLKYFDEFYETIGDSRAAKRSIIEACIARR